MPPPALPLMIAGTPSISDALQALRTMRRYCLPEWRSQSHPAASTRL